MRLLLGGSPCTHWSIAQTKNRETEPSGVGWDLFENYLIAMDKFKPDFFLYENNKSMSKAIREEITKRLGVEPICINSALVSAQNRQRLYWTNIPSVQQPEDRGILLRDILETATREKGYALNPIGKPLSEHELEYMARETSNGRNHFDFDYHHNAAKEKSQCLTANTHRGVPYNVLVEPIRIGTIENSAKNQDFDSQPYRVYSPDGKSVTLCGQGGGVGAKTGLYAAPVRVGDMPNSNGDWPHNNFLIESADGKTFPVYEVRNGLITIKDKQYPIKLSDGFYIIRKLTVTECKRLQTVPDSYVFPVSDTQAYKMLGNGWTVDVIAHILSYCPRITSEPLDVLSMYDGMACGHIALDKLGARIARYRATEIDKYAIKTACYNFPYIEQLGDAFQVRE
nr:DNA cytosine methyltransferase [Flavonifractor sp. An135]